MTHARPRQFDGVCLGKMKARLVLAACALLAGSASAGGAYLGGSWGQATHSVDGGIARVDAKDSGYKLYGGYRLLRCFGVEAAYTDLLDGSETSAGVEFDLAVRYGSVAAVGVLPVHPRLELWAKVEAAYWSADVFLDDGLSQPVDRSDSGIDLGCGVGFDWYPLPRFGIRAEWERFDFGEVENLGYLSAGLVFRFERP